LRTHLSKTTQFCLALLVRGRLMEPITLEHLTKKNGKQQMIQPIRTPTTLFLVCLRPSFHKMSNVIGKFLFKISKACYGIKVKRDIPSLYSHLNVSM